jgi:hypothetical protein
MIAASRARYFSAFRGIWSTDITMSITATPASRIFVMAIGSLKARGGYTGQTIKSYIRYKNNLAKIRAVPAGRRPFRAAPTVV